MKLNLIALSLFAGAAMSNNLGHDETCTGVTKLTGDLDETCQYLHDQQALVAESHGSTEAYAQRRSAPLTVGEATAIALGCYRHFEVVFDDIFALADKSDSVIPGFGETREQLQDKIAELERVSSDDEKCSQPADVEELTQLIELMVEQADEAKSKSESSGILEECSSSLAVVKRQGLELLLSYLFGLVNPLELIFDI